MKFKLIASATEIISARNKKEAEAILDDYAFNRLFNFDYKIIEIKKTKQHKGDA